VHGDRRALIGTRLAQHLLPAERCRAITVVLAGAFVCMACDRPDRGRHISGRLENGALVVLHEECFWEWESLLPPRTQR
jgi:hypothetical protein